MGAVYYVGTRHDGRREVFSVERGHAVTPGEYGTPEAVLKGEGNEKRTIMGCREGEAPAAQGITPTVYL